MFESINRLFNQLLKMKWVTIILPMVLLGIFIFILTLNNVSTETYDIERFNQSKETIRSPITIENELETKRKTRETLHAVQDRYSIDSEINEERIENINEIFEALTKIEQEAMKEEGSNSSNNTDEIEQENLLPSLATDRDKVLRLGELISEDISNSINDSVFIQLFKLSQHERDQGSKLFTNVVSEVMEQGVRAENILRAKSDVKQSIKYSNLTEDIKEALTPLTDFIVVENSFFDPEKTSQAQKEASNNIDPVMIRAGEIIVREGQTITNEIYEELSLVGLLNKERNFYPLIGLIVLILLIVSTIAYEMNRMAINNRLNKGEIISIILISILVITIMKIISIYLTQINHFYYLVPVAMGALLLKLLINERFAIVLASLYAILGSVIFNGEVPGSLNVEAGIYFFFSQLAAIIFLSNVKDRLAIVRAGIGMTIINVLTILVFSFLSFEKYVFIDLLIQSSYGVAAAFISAVLTIGLLPFFETPLGILSDIRLISLASPNQPLLRKLLIEAPGTYHHSIMVANLSETACEAIGANGLLARVGAYYHDMGKTIRPHYFIENQLSIKNPHDLIDPKESAEIIINHPYDGSIMLKKEKLPEEIIDIALQHHGTTLLKYFYFKEKEKNNQISETEFRYPGPKPQTKEAAIICICDSVEAAVRSLKEPTEEKIDEIVSNIVNDRLMDGQFDETPLTIQELKTVHTTVCETLKGIFHSRIQYPDREEESK